MKHTQSRAFTLIELLVVIAIIAILAVAHAAETDSRSRLQEKLRKLVLSEVEELLASGEVPELALEGQATSLADISAGSENFFDDLRNKAEEARR